MNSYLISIVIPLYNSAGTIQKTLEACLSQDLAGYETEVIVVDDGSTDGGVEAVKKYPVKIIRQENSGPASARNKGWRAAKGDIVCFTDSDCVPRRDWIAKLLEGYCSEEVGGVGGTYDIMNADNFLASCIHEEIKIRHEAQPKFVNYLGSFNLSYKKSVLEEVGGFNEEYKRASGEDNDLAYRVSKKGYKLSFAQDSAVAHYHPDRLFKYLRQQFRHGCWRMKIYRDHPDMASGDSYGGMFDFIQPPLALLIAALLPAGLIYRPANIINAFLLLFYLAIQMPLARSIVKRKGDPKYYLFALCTFLRGFYRGAGLLRGLIKFVIVPWRQGPGVRKTK
ncbi:MAG: glycosyltransferase [Nitrospinae bacterium]|nr:glycosyltransferase [Nitrospinota bacterium]